MRLRTVPFAVAVSVWLATIFLFWKCASSLPLDLVRRHPAHDKQRQARKTAVKEAFQHAWDGYSKYCFGHDTLHPVTHTCSDDFGGYGATVIDALPTAIMLGNDEVVVQILEFVAALDFTAGREGHPVQVFEVTIRQLASMMSAWDLFSGPFSSVHPHPSLQQPLYTQIVALGDALCCAFDSPSGIPHGFINPSSCERDSSATNSVAGVGTLILEFAKLSNITHDSKYRSLAQRAEHHLLNPRPVSGEPYPGLLGSFVDVYSGEVVDSAGSWGAFADSFYEYLLKAYVFNSDLYGLYLERWLTAADSTIAYIGSHPCGRPDLTLLATWNGDRLDYRMESLAWFAGGNFILGGMVTRNQSILDFGLSIADAAGAVYQITATGLGGEFVTWHTPGTDTCNETPIEISDGRFRMRPEVLETWYYAYRATRHPKYREWSWAAFEAISRYCRADAGFSAIHDVNAIDGGGQSDVQESFFLAEVLTYVYLTLLEVRRYLQPEQRPLLMSHVDLQDDDVPYHVQDSRVDTKNSWVFNTEGHPFLVEGRPV